MKNKIKTLTDMLHNQFKNVLKGKSEILHFHTTNITTFCYLVDNAFNEVDDRYLLFKYQYTETDILEPYEPFLSIIRDTVEKFNIDIKKLLDKSKVYPAHKILFESYLKGQLPVRLDELVDGEILYEVSQLHKSIGRILCSLSDYQPIIIALAELQFADFATLELIKSLKKSLGKSKVMLIHGYNQNTYFVNADHYEVWNDFITFAEENYSILNLGKDIILKQADWTCFKSKKNMTIHKIATISALNLSFLNFNNAIKSGLKAEALLKDTEDINLSYTVLQVLGDSYYYLDKVENALAYYRMFLELAHKKGNYKQVSVIENLVLYKNTI